MLISDILAKSSIFTQEEFQKLQNLQSTYIEKSQQLTAFEYKKELERLAIDLSWKSSQIEGNTYSLLETERLLKHKETASGKPKDDATMLLNHKEAIESMCELVNNKDDVFTKALLVLILTSYIQAFADGNKRTARIISNAILISNNYCPISFRTIDSVEYKKAMLIFYEQNNITPFKGIFINQFEFAVNTYF